MLMTEDKYKTAAKVLWEHAVEICNLTHSWRPDFTLILLHSAIGPFTAAEELWQQSFGELYPNVVKTNIGREKLDRYHGMPRPRSILSRFIADYEDAIGVSHFMAWASIQQSWTAQLKTQIETVIGPKVPEKILVVDDFHHEGGTELLVFCLLKTLYPKTKFIFSHHSENWKDLDTPWLTKNFPEYDHIEDKEEKRKLRSLFLKTKLGTTDITSENLAWKELTAADPILEPLLKYGTADVWLNNADWLMREIRKVIRQRASEYQPKGPEDHFWQKLKRPNKYDTRYLILCDIWLNNSVSTEEIILRYGLPEAAVLEALEMAKRDSWSSPVVSFHHNGTTRYTIDLRPWMRISRDNITSFSKYLEVTENASD